MTAHFKSAIPKLASLNIDRSLDFFETLGFSRTAAYPDYGIARRDEVEIHFWLCDDPELPKTTACRVNVSGIKNLFQIYAEKNLIHSNDHLNLKPWGLYEFSILDIDGNLITFSEAAE